MTDSRDTPEIEVVFYPYVGINHTIRLRNGKIFVRLAEICENAPLECAKSFGVYFGRQTSAKKSSAARRRNLSFIYVKSQEMQTKAIENKRAKGRKIITSSNGEIYDLEEIFVRINRDLFSKRTRKTDFIMVGAEELIEFWDTTIRRIKR